MPGRISADWEDCGWEPQRGGLSANNGGQESPEGNYIQTKAGKIKWVRVELAKNKKQKTKKKKEEEKNFTGGLCLSN